MTTSIKLKLVAAAVLTSQGIFPGACHCMAVMAAEEVLGERAITQENIKFGFLDESGVFYSREEVSRILGHRACAEELIVA